jgi:hypothetical protein
MNVNPQGATVNLTNAGGAGTSDAFCVRYAYSAINSGVGDASRPIDIRCYPNPMNEALMVTGTSSGQVRVELLDMTGRVLLDGIGSLPLEMNVGNLSPGLYQLRSISAKGVNVVTVAKK